MKKHILLSLCLIICAAVGRAQFNNPCEGQYAPGYHQVFINWPTAIAINYNSSSFETAVAQFDTATGGVGNVYVWSRWTFFTMGFPPNDTLKNIHAESLIFDNAGNLYAVQTMRTDSNVLIFNSSLSLVKVINNTPGTALAWSHPRGIAFDSLQNLYITSDDSISSTPRDTIFPNTGKLIEISNPLTTATKSVLLRGLNAPKSVAINAANLYITENGANKVSRYEMGTLVKLDSVTVPEPMDVFTTSCILYVSQLGTHSINTANALDLAGGVVASYGSFDAGYNPLGLALNFEQDLFSCSYDSNQVVIYRGYDTVSASSVRPDCNYVPACLGDTFHMSDSGCAVWNYRHSAYSRWDTLFSVLDSAWVLNGNLWNIYDTSMVIGDTTYTHTDTTWHHTSTTWTSDTTWTKVTHTVIIGGSTVSTTDTQFTVLDTLSGLWYSTNTFVATVGSTGLISCNNTGIDTVYYVLGKDTLTLTLFIAPCGTGTFDVYRMYPIYTYSDNGSLIFDSLRMCDYSATQLYDSLQYPYCHWSSSNLAVADIDYYSGSVWPSGPGTTTITCTSFFTGASATFFLRVDAPVSPGIITGVDSLCAGTMTSIGESVAGGVWSVADTAIVSLSSGEITARSFGSTQIAYIVTDSLNTCGPRTAYKSIKVDTVVHPTITGSSSVCVGGTLILTDSLAGGTWSRTNGHATLTDSLVTGVSAGIDTIFYHVSNFCGGDSATQTIAILPLPSAGTITGATSLCTGTNITLTDVASGGVWSASNGNATVADGIVTPVLAGMDTLLYAVTNSCGSDTARFAVTINSVPLIGAISGSYYVCLGSSTMLIDTPYGGSWSISYGDVIDEGPDPFTPGGEDFYGLIGGIDVVTYTVFNACGSASASVSLDVEGDAGVISSATGSPDVCVGSVLTLYESSSEPALGSWSSTYGYASVDAYGNCTGVSVGTDIISFTVVDDCGSTTATFLVNVLATPDPGTITGASGVCVGSHTTLADPVTGGTWSISNTHASITGSGVVTGVTAGIDTISYTVTNSCGTAVATDAIAINLPPVAGTISGSNTVCAGANTTLTDIVLGGVWTSSSAHATVSSSGVVTGVSAGTDTISYTVTNSCGTAIATYTVTINPAPLAGTITGAASLCTGTDITLTDLATGGLWSASNASATVVGGVVSAVSAGIDTISYTVTNSCGAAIATHTVTINLAPVAGTISGLTTVCTGSDITLTDPAAGGTWSASNATATVSGGIVTGVSAGIDTVAYTVTNSCGTAIASYTVTINPAPLAGTITGAASLCTGTNITLTDAATGGTWSASNADATVADGIVSAVSAGIDTIAYTVTNSCGTAIATHTVTINLAPVAGTISGLTTVCTGSDITLTDPATGGTWNASNASATVSGGIVTGVSAGIDTIAYTVTNSCGTAIASYTVTINPAPLAGTITGAVSLCTGTNITLTDAATGGTWSASNADATVVGGIVTAVSAGIDTIAYTVTNSCGTAIATHTVTINLAPVAGTISGLTTVCTGSDITLTDPAAGGTWSASNASATVSGGVVTGVSAGTDTISYTVTNSCGTAIATYTVTINPAPLAGTITGAVSLCTGTDITLTDAATGGTWSASNADATVSGGIVSAVSAGIDTIAYTVTNSCGTAIATHTVTINALPEAGAIAGASSICIGGATTLSDGAAGGIWSLTNGNATNTGAAITGIHAGIDTVVYTVSNGCGTATASYTIAINTTPAVPFIAGGFSVCAAATLTLTDALSGGVWTCSNAHATVSAGIVTGVLAGTDTVFYDVTNTCGGNTVAHVIAILALPAVGGISGTGIVCMGAAITLTDGTPGGSWSAENTNATVSSGVVSGDLAGTDSIFYAVGNSCGVTTAATVVTVAPTGAFSGVITGLDTVCIDSMIILSDTVADGTWSSSDTVATITSSGHATGIANGVALVEYTVINACGFSIATKYVYVVRCDLETASPSPSKGGGLARVDVYPNPAKDEVSIEVSRQAFDRFTITNNLGEQVMAAALDGDITHINTAHLSAGVYYITVQGTSGCVVKKLVVMND